MEIQMDRKRGQGILKVARLVNRMMNDYGAHQVIVLEDKEEADIISIHQKITDIVHKGSYNKEEQTFLNKVRKVVLSYNKGW